VVRDACGRREAPHKSHRSHRATSRGALSLSVATVGAVMLDEIGLSLLSSGSQLETRQTLEHEARPGRCAKKTGATVIRLAMWCPALVLGSQDDVWWSRLAQLSMYAWTEGKPLRLVEKEASQNWPFCALCLAWPSPGGRHLRIP
jgi:hypothetical protein